MKNKIDCDECEYCVVVVYKDLFGCIKKVIVGALFFVIPVLVLFFFDFIIRIDGALSIYIHVSEEQHNDER